LSFCEVWLEEGYVYNKKQWRKKFWLKMWLLLNWWVKKGVNIRSQWQLYYVTIYGVGKTVEQTAKMAFIFGNQWRYVMQRVNLKSHKLNLSNIHCANVINVIKVSFIVIMII